MMIIKRLIKVLTVVNCNLNLLKIKVHNEAQQSLAQHDRQVNDSMYAI